jgi:hypothetical protein
LGHCDVIWCVVCLFGGLVRWMKLEEIGEWEGREV